MGEFFGGREFPLLWKEGEVYLLPLSEEDIGFYKAPGESAQIMARISAHPLRDGSVPPRRWGTEQEGCESREGRSFGITDRYETVNPPACLLLPLFRRSDLSDSLAAVTRTRFASTPLSQPLEDKGNKPAWPQDLGGHFYQAAPAAEALMELDVLAALERQQSENWLSFPPRGRRRCR